MNQVPLLGVCFGLFAFALLIVIGILVLALRKPRRLGMPLCLISLGVLGLVLGVTPIVWGASRMPSGSTPITPELGIWNPGGEWCVCTPDMSILIDDVTALAISPKWLLVGESNGRLSLIRRSNAEIFAVSIEDGQPVLPADAPGVEELRSCEHHHWNWLLLGD